METRNVKLTFEKAKEWYKKGGELREVALQAFTEGELTIVELPKTWEEFCIMCPIKKGETYIDKASSIPPDIAQGTRDYQIDKNVLPSRQAAQAHLALMQLHQLRDCYRQGWVPDWNDTCSEKWCIVHDRDYAAINLSYTTQKFLSFQTLELAMEFRDNFEQLLIQAGDLI